MYIGMVVVIGLSAHVYLESFKRIEMGVSTPHAPLVQEGIASTSLESSYAFRWTSDNFSGNSSTGLSSDYHLYTEEQQMEAGKQKKRGKKKDKASASTPTGTEGEKRSVSDASGPSPGLRTVVLDSPAEPPPSTGLRWW